MIILLSSVVDVLASSEEMVAEELVTVTVVSTARRLQGKILCEMVAGLQVSPARFSAPKPLALTVML